MGITLVDRNGPPGAMTCPAVICDTCQEPIHGAGLVTWRPGEHVNKHPVLSDLRFVHRGKCDNEKDTHHRDLVEFLDELRHNVLNAFESRPGVEYVAPSPSRWRIGRS